MHGLLGLRQLAATAGALMVAFALVLLGAPPSAAGGPTSVLLASSTSRRTASLYITEEAYGRLEKLLAPAGAELDRSQEETPEWGQEAGDSVTVTWMAHDISPWRVDRVFLSVPGSEETWIHTMLSPEDAAEQSDPGVWHRAGDPKALWSLLTDLGVTGEPSDSPAQAEPPPPGPTVDSRSDTKSSDEPETTAGDKANASEPSLLDRGWWAIPALLLGLALGSTATLLLSRRVATRPKSGPPREPRQKLIDA
ncbi:hypothetical protein Sipo8835_43060 [Streptomyces ipomoeae]|jgi:hypothetical protein|uniref:Uncharacterized protein n=3 Tax=Streptomyces ipomoeae TaxID=103232 RepID=L1L504_9ACTN|nr:hypothetical protein [Streptomyces ipomoeae]EKX68007.1 hypothetical protein STRIP9103_06175 [Streptomyces ipomoeae 91-03]TQE16639.1 hypothetical protein Sipo8835_43060 [Streptomyces ipomoeae]TQE24084.1 hypothetical protein Sipo7851_36410 [Streptomyces ipomoeae]